MKQLIRPRVAPRLFPARHRRPTADPAVAAELAVIAEVRRAQEPTFTA